MSKPKHSVEISNSPTKNTSESLKIHDRSLDFRLWIGLLLFAADEDTSPNAEWIKKHSNKLHECISSGARRRFIAIKKSDVVQWANDKTDASPTCQEAKAHLHSHPRGADLPDELMLKVLAEYIQKTLVEQKEAKGNPRSIPNESVASDLFALGGKNTKPEKEKKGEMNSREGTTRSPSKRSKESARPITPSSSSGQTSIVSKGKLRNRQIHKLKLSCLDDEPVDGPDLYILLQEFHSLSFLEFLLQADIIPIHSVTAICDLPNLPTNLDKFHLLKYNFLSAPASTHTIFTQLSFSSLTSPTSFFDAIAFHYYTLCNEEQIYEQYYVKHPSIRIPIAHIPDIEAIRKDKSIEKEVLYELINYVDTYEQDFYKSSFRFSQSSEGKKSTIKSRLSSLIKLCSLDEPFDEWKHETFAKVANIHPLLAEHYMDLYDFESLVGHALTSHLWVERIDDEKLLERIEAILAFHPNAITRFRKRGNKVLLSVHHSERSSNRSIYPLIPFKLSIGDWYELKVCGALDPDLHETTYEIDADLISKMIRIPSSCGVFTIDERGIMEKHCYCNVTNPNIICSIYPNRFYAFFPYNGSKLFLQLHCKSPSSVLSTQVFYVTSNGWHCFRSAAELRGNSKEIENVSENINKNIKSMDVKEMETPRIDYMRLEEDCFCIQIPFNDSFSLKKLEDASASINWRKVYKNGDQWIKMDNEIHFYGRDGQRGYKRLDVTSPQTWTWISSSGEVFNNYQSVSQLRMTKHVDPSNKSTLWWREDDTYITFNSDDDIIKVTFSDQTTVMTLTDGSVFIKMPRIGELKIIENDFIFTDLSGAQIQFSEELVINMPHNFLFFTKSKQKEIIFPGHIIDLKEGKALSTDNNNKISIPCQSEKEEVFSDDVGAKTLVWLCVLQKAPFPSYIFYHTSTIDILMNLIERNTSNAPMLIKCASPENIENFALIDPSSQIKDVIRSFTKISYISPSLRKKLEEFFSAPPETSNIIVEDESTNLLLTLLKTRTRPVKMKEKLKLTGELLSAPDFEKISHRAHFAPVPFQPYLDPECKKFKFVPIPYFKSEQGQLALKRIESSSSVPLLTKPRSSHLPTFLCSDFNLYEDPRVSSTSSLHISSPKLVPKDNKASRLRLSRTTLSVSSAGATRFLSSNKKI